MAKIYMIGNIDEADKFKNKRNTTLYLDEPYNKAEIYKLKQEKKNVDFKNKMSPIVSKELARIRQCDFLVVKLDSHKIPEDIMTKIMFAYQLQKRAFIIYDGKWEDLHDWALNFVTGGIYKSVDSLQKDLK